MKTTHTYSKGFTLIELLVVISMISLLSSVIVATLGSARSKARAVVAAEVVNQYKIAFEQYITEHNAYPATSYPSTSCMGVPGVSTCVYYGWEFSTPTDISHTLANLAPNYMSSLTEVDTGLIEVYGDMFRSATYQCGLWSDALRVCYEAVIVLPIQGTKCPFNGPAYTGGFYALPSGVYYETDSDGTNTLCYIIITSRY